MIDENVQKISVSCWLLHKIVIFLQPVIQPLAIDV